MNSPPILSNGLTRIACLPILVILVVFVLVDEAVAQKSDPVVEKAGEESKEPDQTVSWESFVPSTNGKDWVQLKSGEWLKGTIEDYYQDKFEFDSDELGLLTLDSEDVKKVRSGIPLSVRFTGPVTVNGFLEIDGEDVSVLVGDERKKFKRSELFDLGPGDESERNYWSAKLSLGMTMTRGNTDQLQMSTIGNAKRRTLGSRYNFDYLGNYTNTDGTESVNNHRLSGDYNILKSPVYFLRPIFGEYFRDPLKNITRRVTVGAGVGYYIIDRSNMNWEITGGPAYQWTQYDTVETGQNEGESTLAFIAGTHFYKKFTKTSDFDFSYGFQLVDEDSGTYNHHLIGTLSTELTRLFDLDVSVVWDRVQDPTPDENGITPEQDDFYLIVSLGFEY